MKKKNMLLLLLISTIVLLTGCYTAESRTIDTSTSLDSSDESDSETLDKEEQSETNSIEETEGTDLSLDDATLVTNTSNSNTAESPSSESDTTNQETDGNYIVVTKSERQLTLYDAAGNTLAQYAVGLAQNPVGAKEKEGDKKTPEGEYYICTKNTNSKFHKALGLSYPNIQDAERGVAEGLITEAELEQITEEINSGEQPDWYTALGGEIMIHGQKGNLGSQSDWTTGCIAVNNDVIDALWDQVQVGTKVTILP